MCPLREICKLHSRLTLFPRDLGKASAAHSSGPAVAEAQWRLKSWGSQIELGEEIEKGMGLSRYSVTGLSDLLDQDVLSLVSDLADSAAGASQDEADVVEESEDPAYKKLLDVMARTTARLDLVLGSDRQDVA